MAARTPLDPDVLDLLQIGCSASRKQPDVKHDSVLFILVVMLYPMVFWIVLRLLAPEYFSIPNRRLKVMSVGIVIVIVILGYASASRTAAS